MGFIVVVPIEGAWIVEDWLTFNQVPLIILHLFEGGRRRKLPLDFLGTHAKFLGIMSFDACHSLRLESSIDIDSSFEMSVLSHLSKQCRVYFSQPVLPNYFEFLHLFTTFLEVQEVEDVTEDIDDRAGNGLFEALHLEQLIYHIQIFLNDALALVRVYCLSDKIYYCLLPTLQGPSLQLPDELFWVEVINIPQLFLQCLYQTLYLELHVLHHHQVQIIIAHNKLKSSSRSKRGIFARFYLSSGL